MAQGVDITRLALNFKVDHKVRLFAVWRGSWDSHGKACAS